MADRSRARAPQRRSYRVRLLAIPLGFAAFAACGDSTCENGICVDESGMRLIDRICTHALSEGPACELSGDAEQASAVTADSVGYRLGDGGGSLTIHVKALEAATHVSGIFDIEVLAASRDEGARPRLTSTLDWGSCTSCPIAEQQYPAEVRSEYSWVTVVTDQAAAGQGLPYDAVLTLSGAGIDIADMRATSVYPDTCSIVGPVGAPR